MLSNGKWAYYPYQGPLDMTIFSNNVKKEDIILFLSLYLGKGEKLGLPIFRQNEKLSTERLQHTLSCFLLGKLLYIKCNVIASEIDAELTKYPNNIKELLFERFKYVWMLTCIFHDFGYCIEDGKIEFNWNDFDSLMKKLPRRSATIPNIYTKELLKKYERFRLGKYCVYDHGICGGIKLYFDLCELREKKELENNGNLNWAKVLEKSFSLAAWAVACHNIWFVKASDKNAKCYRHYKLDKLIYEGISREIKKSPLLFLLCLVDSIEPIKVFHDHELTKYLEIEFKDNTIGLLFSAPNINNDKYTNRIKGLNDWLCDISQQQDKLLIHL